MTPTSPNAPAALTWLGPLILAVGAVCVGLAPIGLRESAMDPQPTAFWRFLTALPMLWATAKIAGVKIERPNRAALLTGLFFGIDIAFWHAALVRTSVANATFIVNIGSVSSGLLAYIVLKHPLTRTWPLGAALALAGAGAMSFGGGAGGSGDWRGDVLAIGGALMLANYFVFASIARRTINAFSAIFWATAVATLVAAAATFVTGERLMPTAPSDLAAPLFLAVVAQVLGQGFILWGAGLSPPSVAGVMVLLQPVVAGLIAWPLYGEPLSPAQGAGAAGILLGVWLATKRN